VEPSGPHVTCHQIASVFAPYILKQPMRKLGAP
jgi:hypothetical protein